MAKTYPKQLGDWVKQRVSTRRDMNLVAFLAVREDVKVAVEAGFSVKTVWRNMRETGRIDFGYDTFLNHVNRLIRRASVEQRSTAPQPSPKMANDERKQKLKPAHTSQKVAKPAAVAGFTFNPEAKKEDLI